MIIKPSKEIIKEVLEAYNRDPRGWHVLYRVDKSSRLNIYIGKKSEDSVWAILTEPHFGIGARIDDINIEEFYRKEGEEFGLRPIPEGLGESVIKEFFEHERLSSTTIKMLREELKKPPKKMKELGKAKLILVGPSNRITHIDERIKEKIGEKVLSKLESKFEKRLKERLKYIA